MEQPGTFSPRILLLGLVAVIALVAFGAGVYLARHGTTGAPGPEIQGFLWPEPTIVGDFSLQDANGGEFTAARLDGKWTLLFFGFTHCPDVCPTTLTTLKSVRAALRDLPAFDQRAQVLFVSVDAARDSPEALRAYVDYFDPGFLAATALPAQLNVLTRQLGILYAKVETQDPTLYTFDHTASILLIGPARQFLGVFSPPHTADDIAARVRGIVEFVDPR
jgi:protein SCO1/2